MDNVSVSDTGSNLLITGSSEAAVAAALRDLMQMGATISAIEEVSGEWSAVCDVGKLYGSSWHR